MSPLDTYIPTYVRTYVCRCPVFSGSSVHSSYTLGSHSVPNSDVVLYTDQIAEAAASALYIEVSLIHWLYTAHA